jgi:glucose/arabinose dehydrogenase
LPRVVASGQGGLLEVALHPRFSENQIIYMSYAGPGDGGVSTELARAKLGANRLEDLQVIFRQEPKTSGGLHFGGRIVFDRAGFLYLTLGERGQMQRAQVPGNHHGSVIRLHDDGRVPQDNPFVGKEGWRPEKFDLGHRNQQGAALHPQTGALWTHEHGPQGGDEINIIRAGTNYGWPVITYGVDYSGARIGVGSSRPGMEQPVYYWDPVIAPSGALFYTGERFRAWRGDLFVGSLQPGRLVRLRLSDGRVVLEERYVIEPGERIRDVRQGPDGLIYLLTDNPQGRIVRLEPTPGS